MDPLAAEGDGSESPFIFDAATAQSLLAAAAARKTQQLGQSAATTDTRMGAGTDAATAGRLPTQASKGVTSGQQQTRASQATTAAAAGRHRTGTALGLKRRPAAVPSEVSPSHNMSSFTVGHGSSSPTTPLMRFPSASDPAAWDNHPHPQGGFMNLVNSPPPIEVTSTPPLKENQFDVDNQYDVVRTKKQIMWTQEEDVRLMSAWLEASTDSIVGADRRNDQYWGDVVKKYNMTTPNHRVRNQKQAKDRWHKINKWTDLFHSAWLKARRIFTSGHSDQMWIDKAQKFYEEDNKHLKLGPYVLMDVWYTVRGVAKWITYNNDLNKGRKRKGNVTEGSTSEKDDEDYHELPRPMGQKKEEHLSMHVLGGFKWTRVSGFKWVV